MDNFLKPDCSEINVVVGKDEIMLGKGAIIEWGQKFSVQLLASALNTGSPIACFFFSFWDKKSGGRLTAA